jgi:hypothetical protein
VQSVGATVNICDESPQSGLRIPATSQRPAGRAHGNASAGREGYVFALDARTGALLWKAAV